MPTNPNQTSVDKAYKEGVNEAKSEGLLVTLARDMADLFVPESLKSDEQRANDRGHDDARRGKA
jgi:hypothetical protein